MSDFEFVNKNILGAIGIINGTNITYIKQNPKSITKTDNVVSDSRTYTYKSNENFIKLENNRKRLESNKKDKNTAIVNIVFERNNIIIIRCLKSVENWNHISFQAIRRNDSITFREIQSIVLEAKLTKLATNKYKLKVYRRDMGEKLLEYLE
ncbi:hypothetical protein RhiirA1_448890 [Rhizophagus irregularis]|uniref:Uncharacterized protein n=1 Tax=Rhizophagus irregularis TaxID=588596 RepID=A0A2I1EG13_9GLOM|nr:hypothetical protein RhiirA1_448890 [Rhizophagus irregularis]PKY21078.1 hypothetical protein RhiirB3_434579 [Rhizophagus irregularis]